MKHSSPKVWISDVTGDRLGTRNLRRAARKSTRNEVPSWEPGNDLRNFQCRPNSAYYSTFEIIQKSGTQIMFCFWLEKRFCFAGFEPQNRWQRGSRCLLFLVSFRTLSTGFFQMLQMLLASCCPTAINHENPSSKAFQNTDSLHQENILNFWLPGHFSLKPGTSACRPNEVVAGPGSTVGCCHRCW